MSGLAGVNTVISTRWPCGQLPFGILLVSSNCLEWVFHRLTLGLNSTILVVLNYYGGTNSGVHEAIPGCAYL